MRQTIDVTPITTLALAMLSMLTGMLLFEMSLLVDQLPTWGLLTPFFSVGVVYKVIEQITKREKAVRFPPRIVTVEFNWSLVPQEAFA